MITNFKFESGFVFIEAKKDGIAKAYEYFYVEEIYRVVDIAIRKTKY